MHCIWTNLLSKIFDLVTCVGAVGLWHRPYVVRSFVLVVGTAAVGGTVGPLLGGLRGNNNCLEQLC
jgi:hypothetical protein